MLRLNIGCGEFKLDQFVNIDCEESVKPDLLLNVVKESLPYKDGEVDEIWLVHTLEHIEYFHWDHLLREFLRILKPNGVLFLSYPEFGECSRRFLSNENEKRDFWRATLYGRQLYKSDYHVCPMHSPYIKLLLEPYGFYRISFRPESENASYNTILVALKDPSPVMREDVIVKELGLAVGDAIELVGKVG